MIASLPLLLKGCSNPPTCGPQGHDVHIGVGWAFITLASFVAFGLGLSIGITIEVTLALGVLAAWSLLYL